MTRVITDLTNEPLRSTPKPIFGRNKPKRRKLSELSDKEIARLRLRSNGVCERCDRQRAIEKAHVERRWNSIKPPTAEDVIDLCKECHAWADSGSLGRKWLLKQQKINIRRNLQ